MDDSAAVPAANMTIRKHFRGKDRLVGAVMERYMREQHDIVNRKLSKSAGGCSGRTKSKPPVSIRAAEG